MIHEPGGTPRGRCSVVAVFLLLIIGYYLNVVRVLDGRIVNGRQWRVCMNRDDVSVKLRFEEISLEY